MTTYKYLALLSFSILISFSTYGQQGTASAADHGVASDDSSYAFTIGEVLNAHIVNADNSNKLGVLQPIKKMSSFVTEALESSINIFPNPAIDYINVSIKDSEKYSYTINDTAGKLVLSGILSYDYIDLSSLIQGAYVITLQSGKEITTKQFQKFTSK